MNLEQILNATGGRMAGRLSDSWHFTRLSTDSRTAAAGDLFVALKGNRYDGNDFIEDAIRRGVAVVVCRAGRASHGNGPAFIEVGDTLRALGDIAALDRRSFAIPVIAITGTNGKTTTKEMLRSILAVAYGADRVLANEGNRNNLIGLPQTLLKLARGQRAAVVEMGMNAPGEIARLTEVTAPTHGLITGISPAHLSGLGSLEGVVRAKRELFENLGRDATAVVNLDDQLVVDAASVFPGRRFCYGSGAGVGAEDIVPLGLDRIRFHLRCDEERLRVELALGGRHNVANALAAAACASALGLSARQIVEGLEAVRPPAMRLVTEELANSVVVVNDAYNANPASLEAALDTVAEGRQGRRMLVLGDMLELGESAAHFHVQAGRAAARWGAELLCLMGEQAMHTREGALAAGLERTRVVVADEHGDAARAVAQKWRPGDTVLVKGSRGLRMERVIELLRSLAEQ